MKELAEKRLGPLVAARSGEGVTRPRRLDHPSVSACGLPTAAISNYRRKRDDDPALKSHMHEAARAPVLVSAATIYVPGRRELRCRRDPAPTAVSGVAAASFMHYRITSGRQFRPDRW